MKFPRSRIIRPDENHPTAHTPGQGPCPRACAHDRVPWLGQATGPLSRNPATTRSRSVQPGLEASCFGTGGSSRRMKSASVQSHLPLSHPVVTCIDSQPPVASVRLTHPQSVSRCVTYPSVLKFGDRHCPGADGNGRGRRFAKYRWQRSTKPRPQAPWRTLGNHERLACARDADRKPGGAQAYRAQS